MLFKKQTIAKNNPGIVKEILNEFTPKDEASIALGGPEYTDA